MEPMDEAQSQNHKEKPSVEMFVATAMKQSELLQDRPGIAEVLRTEEDPGDAHCIDCDWPCEPMRSEEHTSELQSHLNLVCRLLLEKKKHQPITIHTSL